MTEINLKAVKIINKRLAVDKLMLNLFNSPKDNKERARIKFTPAIQYELVEASKHKGKKK